MNVFCLSIRLAVSLWAAVLLLGCTRKPDETPWVYKPLAVNTLRDSVAAPPALLSVAIEGIPAANIRIDSIKRMIYVTVPPDVPTATPVAEFVTSPGGRISRPAGAGSPSSPIRLVLGQTYEPLELVYTKQFQVFDKQVYPISEGRIFYTVRYLPAGEMVIGPERSTEVGQPVYLPIRNYYDSVGTDAVIRLTSVTDGRVIEGTGRSQITVNEQLIPAGKVAFRSAQPIVPGAYTIEVVKQREQLQRRLSGARITLRPGRPVLDESYRRYPVTDRGEVALKAFNLYPETPVDLELVSQTGTRLVIKPTRYAADGSSVTVPIAADVPFGYYLVRFRRAGQVVGLSRLMLAPNQNAFRILDITGTDFTTPSEAPIVLKQDSPITIKVSLSSTHNLKIRFVEATDSAQEYVINPPRVGMDAYCFECGTLTLRDIPLTSVPPGRYRLSIRVNDESGKPNDLGPIDRLVHVQ